jgi:hypothetical protein
MPHTYCMKTSSKNYGYERVIMEIALQPDTWEKFRDSVKMLGFTQKNMMGKLVLFYLGADEATRARIESQRLLPTGPEPEKPTPKPGDRIKGSRRRGSETKTGSFPSWMSRVRIPSPAIQERDYSGTLRAVVPKNVPFSRRPDPGSVFSPSKPDGKHGKTRP